MSDFTGGAYYNIFVRFLEWELKGKVVIPPEPELTAALVAAITRLTTK